MDAKPTSLGSGRSHDLVYFETSLDMLAQANLDPASALGARTTGAITSQTSSKVFKRWRMNLCKKQKGGGHT